MNETLNSNSVLSTFLRTLAEKVELNELTNDQLKKTVEFFLKYLFDNENNNSKESSEDFMKFLVMGWYVYSNIRDVY